MLELAATAWGFSLVVTTALFLTVLLVQAGGRLVRSAVRAGQREIRNVSGSTGPSSSPASARELAPAGSRAG